jgi:hypothetical protein
MLSITANQILKVSERYDNLRSDKSFQSFKSIHPHSPPDSNRINHSNESESENSGNDDNFILRKRIKQKTSKSARLNNIRKWLIENAPIQNFDEFHPVYQTEFMTSLQETQKKSKLEMKAKIILQIKRDLFQINKIKVESIQKRLQKTSKLEIKAKIIILFSFLVL